ncbi:MAG: DUF4010 domain-containing protein [Acidobacteria bacterium]|nr:DUF4010 domain-containing protein [Acidobacteriota bacterium]
MTVIEDLLIALALGLLVGLQREWSKSRIAGIRTFPLITLFGALTSTLAQTTGGWIVGAGLLAVTAMLVVADIAKMRSGAADPGLTTEIAALAMYGVGAAVAADMVVPAIVITGSVAVLLQFKQQLHAFVARIEEADLRAAARLALIGLVILPAMPDVAYGPYGVLNPFQVWLMVVLIVGISLGAYVSYRLLGAEAGAWAAGLLGGLISSTATTATHAQSSRQEPTRSPLALAIVVTASAVVFARVLVEVAVVAPAVLTHAGPPLGAMLALMIGLAWLCQRRLSGAAEAVATAGPPTGLRSAIAFGALYAVVLLAVAFAKAHFGNQGLYVVAALSGLTDMDAITLSTVQLIQAGSLKASVGWRLILVGALANLCFKAGLAAAVGTASLARGVAAYFGVAVAAGALILAFWTS